MKAKVDFGGAPRASFSSWGGAWTPLSLIAGLLSTEMGSAAHLGGCCESREGVEGTFGVLIPWSWCFSSFSFLARVHGQFGES